MLKKIENISLLCLLTCSIINPQWLELPLSRTNFHSPKGVRAIKVFLKCNVPFWKSGNDHSPSEDISWCIARHPSFALFSLEKNNFCDILFAFLNDVFLQKWSQRLEKRNCFRLSKFFLLTTGLNRKVRQVPYHSLYVLSLEPF